MLNLNDTIIDSRDIEERINELESLIDDYESDIEELQDSDEFEGDGLDTEDQQRLEQLREDLEEAQEELNPLTAIRDEVSSSEWDYGLTLIHEDVWVDYVKELCEDIGEIPSELPSYIVVDWDATADNISVDYSTVTIEGNDYYYRA